MNLTVRTEPMNAPIIPATNPLFKDRVPEAAAQQLASVLAWLAECQLATLEDLEGRKSTSKRELERQTSICDTAVRQCFELGVSPLFGLNGQRCLRLGERLSAIQPDTSSARERHHG